MTACLLMYRPPSIHMLGRMLEYMNRQERLETFDRTTNSFILKALAPNFNRCLYSQYAESLGKKKGSVMTAEEAKKRRAGFIERLNRG